MKTFFKTFAVLFITAIAITNLHADEKIKIKLHQPPPNMLGVKDLWKLDITNTTREIQKIYLNGTASESKKGLIVSGKSKVLTISPGTKSYDYNDFKNGGEVTWKDRSIQEVLLRTGNVPEGDYTICVTAFYENNEVADQEQCIEQSIKQMGSITSISPSDGAELDSKQPVLFSWTPLVPKPGGTVTYRIKVWQLMQGQNGPQAMRSNQPVVTKDVDNITQVTVSNLYTGPCKPPYLCDYIWNVQVKNSEGFGENNVTSEPSTFKIIPEDTSGTPSSRFPIVIITFGFPGNCPAWTISLCSIQGITDLIAPTDNTAIGMITYVDDSSFEMQINKKTGLTPASFDKHFPNGYFILEQDYTIPAGVLGGGAQSVEIKKGSYPVTEKDGILTIKFFSKPPRPHYILFPDDKPFVLDAKLNSKIHGREITGNVTLHHYGKELNPDDKIYLLEATWAGATSKETKLYERLHTNNIDARYIILESPEGELFAIPVLLLGDPIIGMTEVCSGCPTDHDKKQGCSTGGTFCFCLIDPINDTMTAMTIPVRPGVNATGLEIATVFYPSQWDKEGNVSVAFDCVIPKRQETAGELKARGIITMGFSSKPPRPHFNYSLFPGDKPFVLDAKLNSKIHGREITGNVTLHKYEKELKPDDKIYLLEPNWAGATSKDPKIYERLHTNNIDARYIILESPEGELFGIPILVLGDPVIPVGQEAVCAGCPTDHDKKQGCSGSGTFCFCLIDIIVTTLGDARTIPVLPGFNGTGIEIATIFYPSKWDNDGDVFVSFECIIPKGKTAGEFILTYDVKKGTK